MKTLSQDAGSARNEDLREHLLSDPGGRKARREGRLRIGRPSCGIVRAPLLRHDPININYSDGADVYLPESETISARLGACANQEAVCRVVHEELCGSFGLGAVGSRQRCAPIAKEIWQGCEDAAATTAGPTTTGARALN